MSFLQCLLSVFLLLLASSAVLAQSWDTTDFELFDVVEEVGENFYTMLGLTQDATTAEVRRAYRKLSLQMHPDKNDSPDAEVKFRNLVAVYEILKDEEKRQRYDLVLRDGLPDWRQPIYYYRKARKMSVIELFVFLSVIITVGHYIVAWSIYLEKKFEMEELMNPVRKKLEKKKAKGKSSVDDDELAAAEKYLENQIGCKRPEWSDLVPFMVCRFFVRQVKMIPFRFSQMKDALQAYKELRQNEVTSSDESDDEETKAMKAERKKRRRKVVTSVRDASEYEAYEDAPNTAVEQQTQDEKTPEIKAGEWTVKDAALLTRAMVKFPGGTPGRWEKVAHELGRSESEVTKQIKRMRATTTTQAYKPNLNSPSEVMTKKRPVVAIDDSVMTKQEVQAKEEWKRDRYMTQDDVPDDYDDGGAFEEKDRKRKRKKQLKADNENNKNNTETTASSHEKKTDTTEDEAHLTWSQSQQKCLELALAQFDKTVPDRWLCIARAVPGKSKEDCLVRYKELVAKVRQKHAATTAQS